MTKNIFLIIFWRIWAIVAHDQWFDWYWQKYMKPELDRGIHAGLYPVYVFMLTNKAIDDSNFITTFPDDLLRQKLDAELK